MDQLSAKQCLVGKLAGAEQFRPAEHHD